MRQRAISLIQATLAGAVIRPFRLERAFYRRWQTPERAGLRAEVWTAEVERGLQLHGWFIRARCAGEPRGTVVLQHGISSCKESTLWLARWLVGEGYSCLLYDGRAHGLSGGRFCTYGYFERDDCSRVLDFTERRFGPLGAVTIWGTSLGGAVALQTLEIDSRIRCGIVESTFATLREVAGEYQRRLLRSPNDTLTAWALAGAERLAQFPVAEVSPEASASRLSQPVLVIHGDADRNITIAHGRRIFAQLRATGSRWLEIPGGTHYGLWRRGGATYFAALREFLWAHCRSVPIATRNLSYP